MNRKARVIALYLPQFHPIPENDAVWGKGFTEWVNVAQARPLFKGHHQPNIPADLGFYDLRMPEIREAQAELARNAGIEGFMYWQYWFGNGRMLLQRPFEEVLKSGKPDIPFCLAWANHSWATNSWKREKSNTKPQMIMELLYPGDDDIVAHFNYNLPAFKDPRYITIDGKPLFGIFSPFAMPDAKHFIEVWQRLAKENGLKGIHFMGFINGDKHTEEDLFELGFDSVNCRNLFKCYVKASGNRTLQIIQDKLSNLFNKSCRRYDYQKIVNYLVEPQTRNEMCFPTLLPNWDRSPRDMGASGTICVGSTPERFRTHIKNVLEHIKHKEDEHKVVILMSWNEWAEGNYMEPDRRYGHQYLDTLREELGN